MCNVLELVERMKIAMQYRGQDESAVQRTELFPGSRYRDERGRMVTIISLGPKHVKYRREGYREHCELSRSDFKRKYPEVVG